MNYVVGFLYSKDRDKVILIRKNRPEWQAGKLNGVGGKIEGHETPIDAMNREFKEEAGLIIKSWKEFCILKGDWGSVYCFKAFEDHHSYQDKEIVISCTDEPISVYRVTSIYYEETVPNLEWLIPMSLDHTGLTAIVENEQEY